MNNINAAGAANVKQEWLDMLAKLGQEVIAVRVQTEPGSPIHAHPEIERALGVELAGVKAGQYDSSFYHFGIIWHFFHVTDLAKAMAQLKAGLAARGLLAVANILHAETATQWREYWPATAKLVVPEGEHE